MENWAFCIPFDMRKRTGVENLLVFSLARIPEMTMAWVRLDMIIPWLADWLVRRYDFVSTGPGSRFESNVNNNEGTLLCNLASCYSFRLSCSQAALNW